MLYNFNSISQHPILKDSKGVYCIHCLNGKDYIGSTTVNFRTRLLRHLRELKSNKHHSLHLQNAFNKYGIDSFSISLIYIGDNGEKILTEEQWYIDNLKPEFNMSLRVDYPKCVLPEILQEAARKQKNTIRIKNSRADLGVCLDGRTGKYRATITIHIKQEYLGVFDTYEEALEIRKKAEKDYWYDNKEFVGLTTEQKSFNLSSGKRVSGTNIRKTKSDKYEARIRVKNKQIALGRFNTYDEALEVKLEAEAVFWTENFQKKDEKELEYSINNFLKSIKTVSRRSTKTGYNYIREQAKRFYFYYNKPKYYQSFFTLEEAVLFRDNFIKNLEKLDDIS